jgi:hypothetical protein
MEFSCRYRARVDAQPPPSTIVNPHAPAGHGEVLVSGDDKDPWRPSRAQVMVALTVASIGLVVAGVTVAVNKVRTEHRLDREALAALQLVADQGFETAEGRGPDTVEVALRNESPHAVRLLSARLDADGFGALPLDSELAAGESVVLAFPNRIACSRSVLTDPADAVVVRLRTHRGQVVTRREPLSPTAFMEVNRPAQERCGYLPADEAFGFLVGSIRYVGDQVVARLQLYNNSLLPLALARLREAPGLSLELSRPLPLALPPQDEPQAITRLVDLELRLRMVSCSSFLEAAGGGDLFDLVQAWVQREGYVVEVPLQLAPPTQEFDPFALHQQLVRNCSDVVVG